MGGMEFAIALTGASIVTLHFRSLGVILPTCLVPFVAIFLMENEL